MHILEKALYENLTDSELRKLSHEETSLYMTRPTREAIKSAKFWMRVRVAALIGGGVYLFTFLTANDSMVWIVIMLALAGYEIGYYELRQEKLENEYRRRSDMYLEGIQKLKQR